MESIEILLLILFGIAMMAVNILNDETNLRSIKGKVVIDGPTELFQDLVFQLNNTETFTKCSTSGEFCIKSVPIGRYSLTAYSGSTERYRQDIVISKDKDLYLEIKLIGTLSTKSYDNVENEIYQNNNFNYLWSVKKQKVKIGKQLGLLPIGGFNIECKDIL